MPELTKQQEISADNRETLDTLILTATPAQPVASVVEMAYRIGRAQGVIEGLYRAAEIGKEPS